MSPFPRTALRTPACRSSRHRPLADPNRYSAFFDDFVTGEADRHLLLDHILLAPGLRADSGLRVVAGTGTVEHAAYEALAANQGSKREDRPSDHRPVSVTLQD
jgi:hypothetical protein